MFDFPASPAVGQEFTSGSVTYVFNGYGWGVKAAASANPADYVLKIGDTMVGDLQIKEPTAQLILNKTTAASAAIVVGSNNGSMRWSMRFGDGTAESGGDVGSNFTIYAHDDTGGAKWVALKGYRATGLFEVRADPTTALGIATKGYVDSNTTTKGYVDTQDALRVAKAGDNMSGPLTLSADPLVPLGAATKQYVDTKVAGVGGGTASSVTFTPTGNIAATNVQAAIAEVDSEKVAKAGDVMTGNLALTAAGPILALNKTANGNANSFAGQYNGSNRWLLQLGNGIGESGSNSGSDFAIYRYNDAGALIDSPLNINRATGNVTLGAALNTGSNISATGNVAATGWLMAGGGIANSGWGNDANVSVYFMNAAQNQYMINNNGTVTFQNCAAGSSVQGRFWGVADGTPIWTTGGGLTGVISGSGQISLYSGSSPIFQARTSDDNNAGLGVLNNAATMWAFLAKGNGNVEIAANTTTGGQFISNAGSPGFQCNGSYALAVGGTQGNPYTQYLIGANPNWAACYFRCIHNPGVEVYFQWTFPSLTFELVHSGVARKPGGGAWADNSDARIKTVKSDYEHGLAEILQLNPVRFVFKGNDTSAPPTDEPPSPDTPPPTKMKEGIEPPYANSSHYGPALAGKEYIGLVAQAAEVVMPEMVTTKEGYIDGVKVDDIRELDNAALVYALVNAVKTLNTRIEALEAKGA